MAPTFSTVRGRSLKWDSTTRKVTTGSATICSVSWHWMAATSWESICKQITIHGTTPSTVRSLWWTRQVTTSCEYLDTRVTSDTMQLQWAVRRKWCSPLMTVTTIYGPTTAQYTTAEDSGTSRADTVTSTLLEGASVGICHTICQREIYHCSHLGCGLCVHRSVLRWILGCSTATMAQTPQYGFVWDRRPILSDDKIGCQKPADFRTTHDRSDKISPFYRLSVIGFRFVSGKSQINSYVGVWSYILWVVHC